MLDGVDDGAWEAGSESGSVSERGTGHLKRETEQLRMDMAKLKKDFRKLREAIGSLKAIG